MHGDRWARSAARSVGRLRRLVLGVTVALVAAACTSRQRRGLAVGLERVGFGLRRSDGHAARRSPRSRSRSCRPTSPSLPRASGSTSTMPTFSDPTNITNPLFPVSSQDSVLMLGHVDGKPFRTEVTLLPETRIIEWEGQRVETLVSQYNAFLDGRIQEVAYDYYAQADDGSVWYFGEDVFDFSDGADRRDRGHVARRQGRPRRDDHAGRSTGRRRLPDRERPGLRVRGGHGALGRRDARRALLGPIEGGILAEELHSDGTTEQKVFAPGYGEFYTAGGGDVEALALAVPTDALRRRAVPAELTTLSDGALEIFDAAGSGDWAAASATIRDMEAAWQTYRGGDVPRLIEPRMDEALAALARRRPSAAGGRGPRRGDPGRSLELRPPAAVPAAGRDRPGAHGSVGRAAAGGRGGGRRRRGRRGRSSRSTTTATASGTRWTRATSRGSTPRSARSRSRWSTRTSRPRLPRPDGSGLRSPASIRRS